MSYLLRRGIPGIESDAFHMGFFEDKSSQRVPHQYDTSFTPLFQTMFWFGAMVSVYMVTTCLLFAIREYQLSMKARKHLNSEDSSWSLNSVELDPMDPVRINISQSNDDPVARGEDNVREQCINETRNLSNLNGFLSNQTFVTGLENQAANSNNEMQFIPLEIVENPSTESPNSIDRQINQNLSLLACFKKYNQDTSNLELLLAYKPENVEIAISKELKSFNINSQHLQDSLTIPYYDFIEFQDHWILQKTTYDIFKVLLDRLSSPFEKKITAMRLIPIMMNSNQMNNPNIFISSINDNLLHFIDDGVILDVLRDLNNLNSSKLIVETVLQYCYSHWVFKESKHQQITHQFQNWNTNPTIKPHGAVFRYVINLKLLLLSSPSPQFLNKDLIQLVLLKIDALLLFFIQNSDCNDFTSLLPIFYQSIDILSLNNDVKNQRHLYKLVLKLTKLHESCCMKEYFRNNSSNLKRIIKLGYTKIGDSKVEKLAERLLAIASKYNTEAKSNWIYDELEPVSPPPVGPDSNPNGSATNKKRDRSIKPPGSLNIL